MYARRYLYLYIISIVTMYAAPDCMDNSYHLQRANDPKTYHHINDCYCPCEKQYTILPNSTCSRCGHLHDPRTLRHFNHTAAEPTINLAALQERARSTANICGYRPKKVTPR